MKLSLCPSRLGAKQTRFAKKANTTKKMNVSFRVKYGWKVTFPGVKAKESGSLEPDVCKATRCPIIIPSTMKGRVKCKA